MSRSQEYGSLLKNFDGVAEILEILKFFYSYAKINLGDLKPLIFEREGVWKYPTTKNRYWLNSRFELSHFKIIWNDILLESRVKDFGINPINPILIFINFNLCIFYEHQEVSSCMKRCSLYHYITNNAKYKSAVIVQLNKEIGSDLSKVLLIFQVSNTFQKVFMLVSN